MNLHYDTIAAIATPPGIGGLGIVRISGEKAEEIARRLFVPRSPQNNLQSHCLYHGEIVDPRDRSTLDEVLLAVMRHPHSYTGEDVVEIHCHGGFLVLQSVLQAVLREGARMAEPGEFTKRAFLNGRLDLTQAEAVVDLIESRTQKGMSQALGQLKGELSTEIGKIKDDLIELLSSVEAGIDFPEEDLEELSGEMLLSRVDSCSARIQGFLATYEEGRIYREGLCTVIVGRANVGKSSLLNVLLQEKRAIVTEIPGTTRDVIGEIINIKGVPLKVLDTAGLRKATNIVEEEGIKITREKLSEADIVILVLDGNEKLSAEDREIIQELRGKKAVVAINKIDLPQKLPRSEVEKEGLEGQIVEISAKEERGIDKLQEAIFSTAVTQNAEGPSILINRLRHKIALERAGDSLKKTRESIEKEMSPEFVALDLKLALEHLGEIVGETTTEDILDRIFSDFCIGK
ncbi:MAG: tRNA uridine-5-carboxymethylaminomethyl(34) synthesis GTPase MnmE [Deltaproteobacteria bacterium]|nr:MAG: tRNA uridine-5-carboxymethylaminomethyl(34) synthesis GTPase MnmE [Deltaproteobacteria bacterium]